jgi:hypothetical protein
MIIEEDIDIEPMNISSWIEYCLEVDYDEICEELYEMWDEEDE